MKEALAAVLAYGFEQMKLHRVQGNVAASNTASKDLLDYFGFKYEGTLREDYCEEGVMEDSECYSLLKDEWLLTANSMQP